MKNFIRNFIMSIALCFALASADAQFVTIPDANFRNWLNTHGFASCMNGNQMDTTCSAVVNATSIDCSVSGIINLSGIQYFDNLLSLNCRSGIAFAGPLNSIPQLPPLLTDLNCSFSSLTTLPALPNNLRTLNVDYNHSMFFLFGLSNAFSLRSLSCNANPQLTTSGFPSFTFPPFITDLYLIDDNITGLCCLPSTLTHLECYNFGFPSLTSLPPMPSSLIYLDCRNSLLTSLPTLPSNMGTLIIQDSPSLKCLPPINTITYLYWSNTGITCLPNVITVIGTASPSIAGIPICGSPAITAGGSTTINPGDSITLTAIVRTGWTYQWKLNAVNIAGATLANYKAKTAGNYTCVVTNFCSAGTSNAITVTVASNYVTIPDANFVAWLNANGYTGCMNGNQLDTTCSAVVNATSVNCGNSNISNLTGISYFDNLNNLRCYSNQLAWLPALPGTLTDLDCSFNQLTSLPALPVNLHYFYCGSNQITNFPPLPNSLVSFVFAANQLTSLPALSTTYLSTLNCSDNPLSSLPSLASFPVLQTLYCFNNQLTSLPVLPPSLKWLYCYSNQLTSLPSLPNLYFMGCWDNQLTSLPALPSSLIELYCQNNQLNTLPSLPFSLLNLNCSFNQLNSLPALPDTLFNLIINNNQSVNCLPTIHKINFNFQWNNTGITCLPNTLTVGTATPSITGVSICPSPTIPTSIAVTGGAAKVCTGDTRTYTTPLVAGVTYNWTVPTGAVINSGQGTRTINVTYNSGFTSNGVISVVKKQGCGVSAPKTIVVNRNVPSTPSAITGLTYGLCGATNISYSVTQVAGMTYQWLFPAGASFVNGQGTNVVTVNFPSTNFTGIVSVKAVNRCGAGAARNLTVRALPATPLSITGPVTACANQQNVGYSTAAVATVTSYTWAVPSGAMITSGQGTNSIMMKYGTAGGTVKVRATNVCGNSSYRNLAVTINCREGVGDGNDFDVLVYPNPTKYIFSINVSNSDESGYSLTVRDVIGRVVYQKSTISSNESFEFGEELLSGVYFAEIKQGNQMRILKLIKQ